MTTFASTASRPELPNVLVVDDQPHVREALRLLLKGAGYVTHTAESPKEALAQAAKREHALIVVDMNYESDTTSGDEGLLLIDRLKAHRRRTPVIAMTGWSTIELAVEAMHRGASDFIPKPWDNRQFLKVIDKHIRNGNAASPLDAELAIASKVQRRLLPDSCFTTHGLVCECASLPAGDVSGDLYDAFAIDDEHFAFLVCDVSGKGIGAALLVANLQATIRSQDELARDPSRLLDRVNRLFFESTRPEHYATLFFGVYNSKSRALSYVNCGHPAPALVRAGGQLESLESTATVLGVFKETGFPEAKVTLNAGDRVIMFSDGFSEANLDEAEDDRWAYDMVLKCVSEKNCGLANRLASEAANARGDGQQDDITVMSLLVS